MSEETTLSNRIKNPNPIVLLTETEYPTILNPLAFTMKTAIKMKTVLLIVSMITMIELATIQLSSTEIVSATVVEVFRMITTTTTAILLKDLVVLDSE